MKFIKYLFLTILIFVVLATFIILNLGNFLDISEAPKKSDIIVSLGGGDLDRVKKSLELYQNGYSIKKIIILTGDERSTKDISENLDDKRIKYLKENHLNTDNIIYKNSVKNTIEELNYLKEFMIENKYTSAIIISDAPHTKRIEYLLSNINKLNDQNLNFTIVKSDVKWWSKKYYYKNKEAQIFAVLEGLKLIYLYFIYEIAEPLGIMNFFDKILAPKANEINKDLDIFTYRYLRN